METKRLVLRRFTQADLQDYYEYMSDPLVVEYEPYKPLTLREAKESLNYRISSDEFFAVEYKTEQKVIGQIYLGQRDYRALEIGYVFSARYGGLGYATEGCMALIDEAFSRGIHRIYAECDPENVKSWKLLERLGFVREACLKQNVFFWLDQENQPIWKDTFIYSLLNQRQ